MIQPGLDSGQPGLDYLTCIPPWQSPLHEPTRIDTLQWLQIEAHVLPRLLIFGNRGLSNTSSLFHSRSDLMLA